MLQTEPKVPINVPKDRIIKPISTRASAKIIAQRR